MIAKNIKGTSFASCVKYVMKADAEVLKSEGVMAMDAQSIIDSFEFQRSCRTDVKRPCGHIPISFAPEDRARMTNEFMTQLADEYMKAMGIRNTQYIIVRHNDNDNEHLHIVYNRIDNNRQIISDKNDYRRNIATCKRLKDRHELTYGKGKDRVCRDRLNGADEAKYKIYDAITAEIARSISIRHLQENLKAHDVKMHSKYRRGTDELQGISFSLGEYKFKASAVDRKYSYNNLLKLLTKDQKQGFRVPTGLGGVTLSPEQRKSLALGKTTHIENMTDRRGGIYSAYTRYNEQLDKIEFFRHNPDEIEARQKQSHQQESQSKSYHQTDHDPTMGLGSIFDLPQGGTDNEHEEYLLRKQVQRKKGRKM
ncbi:MAG: relaxase/mobilization nuclease domain-containing protein [Rikenellaceae bacterium]